MCAASALFELLWWLAWLALFVSLSWFVFVLIVYIILLFSELELFALFPSFALFGWFASVTRSPSGMNCYGLSTICMIFAVDTTYISCIARFKVFAVSSPLSVFASFAATWGYLLALLSATSENRKSSIFICIYIYIYLCSLGILGLPGATSGEGESLFSDCMG